MQESELNSLLYPLNNSLPNTYYIAGTILGTRERGVHNKMQFLSSRAPHAYRNSPEPNTNLNKSFTAAF